jgi:hypothetical protein
VTLRSASFVEIVRGRHGREDRSAASASVDSSMRYQITVRYGARAQRYHTYVVEAEDASGALTAAAKQMPSEIAREADLVELRIAADPERRTYFGEEAGLTELPTGG